MTVIVAYKDHDGMITLGADGVSCGPSGAAIVDVKPKIFEFAPDLLVGTTGPHRLAQVIQYLMDIPPADDDVDKFMVGFASNLRTAVRTHDAEVTRSDSTPQMDGRVLVATRGEIFEIDSGYGVLHANRRYHAIGAAHAEAMGAMFALAQSNESARVIVETALAAAVELDLSIRPPFTFLSTNPCNKI